MGMVVFNKDINGKGSPPASLDASPIFHEVRT